MDLYWPYFWAKLTLDLWLNFDSSICTTKPGPPSLGIGCNNSVCRAISRHSHASLTNAFLFAIPSSSITFKESFWDHFQRKCVCCCSEILLLAKKESTLTDFLSLHWWHFLKRKRPEKKFLLRTLTKQNLAFSCDTSSRVTKGLVTSTIVAHLL